jgi:glucokinase
MASGVGIDVGGTKILGVRLVGGDIDHVVKTDTPTRGGPAAVLDTIAGVAGQLLAADTPCVGIGFPGPVVPATSEVGPAANVAGWDGPVDVCGPLSAALGVPVAAENDTNAAAAAEHRHGAGAGCRDMLALWLGTGVGGGLVLDGAVRRGSGYAGEIGHIVVHPGGRRCGCGGSGHLEAYAGRASLEREARRRHAAGETTALVELAGDGRMKSSVFAAAVAQGDHVARDLLMEAVGAVVATVAAIDLVVDLERVVLGGGLAARLGDHFADGIERAASRGFGRLQLEVVRSRWGDHAGAVGAAVLALDRYPRSGDHEQPSG